MSRYGKLKITSEIARFIVKHGVQGKPGSEIARMVEKEFGERISANSVNRVKRINRQQIGEQALRQWEEAVAIEENATLASRLAAYRGVIEREMAKDNPNNRIILEAISAAGQDTNNTYRLMLRMSQPRPEDEQPNSKQRYLNELNRDWTRYVNATLSRLNGGDSQPA